MTNLLGLHFVDSVYTEAHIAKHFDLLRATMPNYVNILGASQYKEALAFAKAIHRELPEIRVIFRHCIQGSTPGGPAIDSQADDTGRHSRMSAQSWWDNIGKQYVGSGLTILTDNESGAADLTYYAQWQADVMTMAARDGLALAVGRFSVLNPPAAQWLQLDAMWRTLAAHYHLHIFSPNCYFSDDNIDGVDHIFGAWNRCNELEIRTPVTVIGEYAYAYKLDPHKGYRAVKMNGSDYVARLIERGSPFWLANIPA